MIVALSRFLLHSHSLYLSSSVTHTLSVSLSLSFCLCLSSPSIFFINIWSLGEDLKPSVLWLLTNNLLCFLSSQVKITTTTKSTKYYIMCVCIYLFLTLSQKSVLCFFFLPVSLSLSFDVLRFLISGYMKPSPHR